MKGLSLLNSFIFWCILSFAGEMEARAESKGASSGSSGGRTTLKRSSRGTQQEKAGDSPVKDRTRLPTTQRRSPKT